LVANRARAGARSSGKPVAMIAHRLSRVWMGESQKVVSLRSECGVEILTYHVVPGRLDSATLGQDIKQGGGKAVLKTVQSDMLTVSGSDW
jgi:hypothetical protein